MRYTFRLALGALIALCAAARAADELRIESVPGELRAALPRGELLWKLKTADSCRATSASWDGELLRLDDGTCVDRFGRVVGRGAGRGTLDPRDGRFDERAAAWDVPVEITPPPTGADAHNPPVFDSAGHAWVFLTNLESGDYALKLRISNGHDGTWGPLQTLSDSTNYMSGPDSSMDAAGNVTVAFRDIGGGYHLYALRYEPGTGWGPLQPIYSSSNYFQAIEVGADAAGNVAVVFDRDVGTTEAAWSLVYHATSGTWGSAQQVSPSGYRVLIPTIMRNASGQNMYLVYLVTSGGPAGLYFHEWDSETLNWSAASFVPGSAIAGFSFAFSSSRFPHVVAPNGDLTVFWENAYPGPYAPHASRRVGGIWADPVQLAELHDSDVDVASFAGAALAGTGDVMCVCTRFESRPGETINRFYAFRHDAEAGWITENPYTSSLIVGTRARCAYYQGERAVGTLLATHGAGNELASILFDGTSWDDELLNLPMQHAAFYQDSASDQGEVLLVYEAEAGGNQGIKGTFLRHPHPGDVNCDGGVDFRDINPFIVALSDAAAYAAAFPDCDHQNADANEDAVVDFRDINPFVLLLTE